MDITQDDLQLMALSKNPIYVENIPIYPVTLNQISAMGYSTYSRALRILCVDKDGANSYLQSPLKNDLQIYDFLIINMLEDVRFEKLILMFLSCICRCEFVVNEKTGNLDSEDFQINRDNFLSFQSIVKLRNCMERIDESTDNPADDKARALLEKRNKYRKKLKEQKSQESNISIGDLVSILASGMNMSINSIMEYDMYQFNDQFNRLRIFKDFEVNVQAILHGADSKNVNLSHWISKIDNSKED